MIFLYDKNSAENINENYVLTEPTLIFKNFTTADIIHVNYGEISLKIEEVGDKYLKCISLNSGIIQRNSLVSVEGKEHFKEKLIEDNKDKLTNELNMAIKLDVEYIVVSIIDNPVEELKKIIEYINSQKSPIKIIAKIDNLKSIQMLDDFLELVQGIYFSRNDLNLKESLSKICYFQKNIVSKSNYLGIPIIIAGTFLETMRTLPNPTRAETSDIYNTILQGVDALLLTSEIISGIYPLEVANTINEICSSCEKRVDYSTIFLEILHRTKKPMKIVEAVASSTVKTSFNLQSPVIVCVTEKGIAGKCVSKYRPYCPVLTITSKVHIAKSLGIVRGLFCLVYENPSDINSVIAFSNDFLIDNKIINKNVNIVLLSGLLENQNGTTDQMRVINVEDYYSSKKELI